MHAGTRVIFKRPTTFCDGRTTHIARGVMNDVMFTTSRLRCGVRHFNVTVEEINFNENVITPIEQPL